MIWKASDLWGLWRCPQLQGFNIATKYYFSLKTEKILDVTTVKPESFNVTTAGTSVPVVADAFYIPTENEVRVYLNKNISDYVSLNAYDIKSTGIKTVGGEAFSFSEKAYFTPEENCELYDVSVANVWFKSGENTFYAQPYSGPCDLYVRLVNASGTAKTATLKISAAGTNGTKRVLKEEKIEIASNGEITKGFYGLSFFAREEIDIELIK